MTNLTARIGDIKGFFCRRSSSSHSRGKDALFFYYFVLNNIRMVSNSSSYISSDKKELFLFMEKLENDISLMFSTYYRDVKEFLANKRESMANEEDHVVVVMDPSSGITVKLSHGNNVDM